MDTIHALKSLKIYVSCDWVGVDIPRVFVGTVSEFCVKHADCPVVTIKRKAEEAPQDPVED